MVTFKTLQRRFIFLLFIPVTLLFLALGVLGYHFIKDLLIKEWRQVAVLRLERAANHVDMRLNELRFWLGALARAGQNPQGREIQAWILAQIEAHPGVSQVKLTWLEPARSAKLAGIRYSYPPEGQDAVMTGELADQAGNIIGRLEVLVPYDYLLQDILTEGWLQTQMACLVNAEGVYLAHSDPGMQARHCLGETHDLLEQEMLQALRENRKYGTVVQPGYFPEHVIGYYKLEAAPWVIMLHAHGSQILAPILNFRLFYLVSGVLGLTVILGLIRLAVRPVVRTIRNLAGRAEAVAGGDYGEPLPVSGADEIGQLTGSFNRMVAGLKERDFISATFGRYVDQEIARALLSRPEALRMGGEKRQVVILFSDVRGFTPLAEALPPEAVIHLVNRHFSRMIEVIQRRQGIIVDFLGDAILAFFDPLEGPLEPFAGRALACALEMQAVVRTENLTEPRFPALHIGIGLHAGEVVVGNIGSPKRAKYGIIGSPVNMTHRIQGQAQAGEVIISEVVLQQAPARLCVGRTFETRLKGISRPVTLYAVESIGGGGSDVFS